jgi:hypothetical protein
MTDETEERLWLEVYDARQRYFESVLGPLPGDILKMLNMTGVWPRGGLYIIPASKIGGDVWVYTTFGLSNHDTNRHCSDKDRICRREGQHRAREA